VKPPAFDYHSPATVEEALALLAEYGSDAKLLAGGQSLVPSMNFRLADPAVLVDLNDVAELFFVDAESSPGVRIGAMTRQRDVERRAAIAERAPLLHETMPFIAHPQIRNRGTIGGSIAHADPAAELPAVMLALNVRFRIRRHDRERWVPADEFFTGLFATALEPDELLVEIEIPPPGPRSGYAFTELSRRHGDYALVGVAVGLVLEEDGRCEQARITLLSVGDGPVLAEQGARALMGEQLTNAAIADAAETVAGRDIDPTADIHASAAYRRQLARVLTRRALTTALGRVQAKL
jgi:carbon-monoxide dehydrogenase medium subunit